LTDLCTLAIFVNFFFIFPYGTKPKKDEWEEEQAAWVEWERKISQHGAPKGTSRPPLASSPSSTSSSSKHSRRGSHSNKISNSSGRNNSSWNKDGNRASSVRSSSVDVDDQEEEEEENEEGAVSLTEELKRENAILAERCEGLMKYHDHVHKRLKEVRCFNASYMYSFVLVKKKMAHSFT